MQFLCQFWYKITIRLFMKYDFPVVMISNQWIVKIRILLVFLAAGCMILLSSCVQAELERPEGNPTFLLDPIFREYYALYGGEDFLGPAISPITSIDGKKAQYLEKALVYYDPDRRDGKLVSFFPIGYELNIEEKGINPPEELEEGALFINQHVIPPEFSKAYQVLGGQEVVGLPLTEVIYSPTYRRYEQYFESLGFYRMEDESLDSVHLLGYGEWLCSGDCNRIEDRNAVVDVKTPINSPFHEIVDQLGIEFTGYLLDYQTSDQNNPPGNEAVFKNVVMTKDPIQEKVIFIQVPKLVGIKMGVMSKYSHDTEMVFIPVLDDSTGYSVHKIIDEYIQAIGGYVITGKPINNYHKYGRFYRQCFEYVCLIHNPDAVPWKRVYPEPLGYTYLRMFNRTGIETGESGLNSSPKKFSKSQVEQSYQFEVWEEYASLSKDQTQIIHFRILDYLSRPMPGLEPSLRLSIPGQGETVYKVNPTDQNGESSVKLPLFIAQNGTLIHYKACVEIYNNASCLEDNYVIWNNP